MRRLEVKPRNKLVTIPTRTEKRERRREAKAEVAARLDKAIEAELLKRLQSGTYGDIYNFPVKEYEKVLDEQEIEEEEEGYEEFVEDEDEEEEEVCGGIWGHGLLFVYTQGSVHLHTHPFKT